MSQSRDGRQFKAGLYGIDKTLSAYVTTDEVKGEEIQKYFLNRKKIRAEIEKSTLSETNKVDTVNSQQASNAAPVEIFTPKEIKQNTKILNDIFKALLENSPAVKIEEGKNDNGDNNNKIRIIYNNKEYQLDKLMQGIDKSAIIYDKNLLNKYGNMIIAEDSVLGTRFKTNQSSYKWLNEKNNIKNAKKYYEARMMGYVVKEKFIVNNNLNESTQLKEGEIQLKCDKNGIQYKVSGSNEVYRVSRKDLPFNFPKKLSEVDWNKLNDKEKNQLYAACKAIVKQECKKDIPSAGFRTLEEEMASVKKLKTLSTGELVSVDMYTEDKYCKKMNWMLRNFELNKSTDLSKPGVEISEVRHTLVSSLVLLSTLNQHSGATDYTIRGDYYMSMPLVQQKSGNEFIEQSVVSTASGSSSYNKSEFLKGRNTAALTVFNQPKGLNIDAMNVESVKNRGKREKEFLKPPGVIKYEEIYVHTYELAALPEKYYLPKQGEGDQSDKTTIRRGFLYVDMRNDGLHYAVINPKGKLINASINNEDLKKIIGENVELKIGCNPNALKPYLREILNHTSSLMHTHGEIIVFSATEVMSKASNPISVSQSIPPPLPPRSLNRARSSGLISPGNHRLNTHSTLEGLNSLVQDLQTQADKYGVDDKTKKLLKEVETKLKGIPNVEAQHPQLNEIKNEIREASQAINKIKEEKRQVQNYGETTTIKFRS